MASLFLLAQEKDATSSVPDSSHDKVTDEPRLTSFPVPSNAEMKYHKEV